MPSPYASPLARRSWSARSPVTERESCALSPAFGYRVRLCHVPDETALLPANAGSQDRAQHRSRRIERLYQTWTMPIPSMHAGVGGAALVGVCELAADHALRRPELGGHLRVELLALHGLALDLELALAVGAELEVQVDRTKRLATLRDGTV